MTRIETQSGQQLDLDGVPVGELYKVTIKAKQPDDGERDEDDQAVDVSGHHETKRTYKVRAQTWRDAVDKAMSLYPYTGEDGTAYTITVVLV